MDNRSDESSVVPLERESSAFARACLRVALAAPAVPTVAAAAEVPSRAPASSGFTVNDTGTTVAAGSSSLSEGTEGVLAAPPLVAPLAVVSAPPALPYSRRFDSGFANAAPVLGVGAAAEAVAAGAPPAATAPNRDRLDASRCCFAEGAMRRLAKNTSPAAAHRNTRVPTAAPAATEAVGIDPRLSAAPASVPPPVALLLAPREEVTGGVAFRLGAVIVANPSGDRDAVLVELQAAGVCEVLLLLLLPGA